MATYTELFNIRSNDSLMNKIAVACAIQADVIRTESGATPNHANRLLWAKEALENPVAKAHEMIWSLLAQNQGATVAQITNATDSAILINVAAAVDTFADGL